MFDSRCADERNDSPFFSDCLLMKTQVNGKISSLKFILLLICVLGYLNHQHSFKTADFTLVFFWHSMPEKTSHFQEKIFGFQQIVSKCFFTVSLKVILSGGDLTVPGLEVCTATQVSTAIVRLSSSTGETYS